MAATSEGLEQIRQLIQICWDSKDLPNDWQTARVQSIFKKGDPSDCNNYRPISLLCIGYKLLATILLSRLKAAGAEARIWSTQFGFKSKSGTAEALFILRRLLEQAWETDDGAISLLALDWAKAFDSISPEGLVKALERFGIPAPIREMVISIYSNRQFFVTNSAV